MRTAWTILAMMVALLVTTAAMPAAAAPLRHDHPLIGIWRIMLPDSTCS
jgi:hypothetical protein